MAKAKAYCTCKTCGESFTREKKCYNRTEADSWEEWAAKNFDLCNKCYAKEQRELEKEKGLYVDIQLNASLGFPIALVFGGDTMPYKDKIKALGAEWTQDYPQDGVLNSLLMAGAPRYRWVLWSNLKEYQTKLEQAKELGATINTTPTETDMALFCHIQQGKDAERKKALEALGELPSWPEEISALRPQGARWNGKFYGRSGNWNVYFSGQQVFLTDKQKEAMEETDKKRQEWRKKKEEIEGRYKK